MSGRPLGYGHQAMVRSIRNLIDLAQQHIRGERQLTDSEWGLLNELDDWYRQRSQPVNADMVDLRARLAKADLELREMADKVAENYVAKNPKASGIPLIGAVAHEKRRLEDKAEGVRLAMSYADEYLRRR